MNPILARVLIYGLLASLFAACGFLDGYRRGELKLFEYKADQAKAAVKIVTKQGAITEKVVTKFVKVKEASKDVERIVISEVTKYVETNPGYCLDVAWGRLHDDAAANTIPDPSKHADGAERAPTAAGAIETVTENYAACHRTADKLDGLQEWVRKQAKASSQSH